MEDYTKEVKFHKRIYKFLKYIFQDNNKYEIMTVSYDLTTNTIECVDWISRKINPFCGEMTPELWKNIYHYCRLKKHPNCTKIYIWAGMDRKHLAYNEPIENYINNPSSLKTGQGFHYGSGKRYDTTLNK